MNKTTIKNFAIWARNKLIADISYRAGLIGITIDGIHAALPQSTGQMEFYDIGTAEPYAITGEAILQRNHLVELIQRKEKDTDYKTAYKYIIEEVAYTWFNRLIAVRFMEVNDYLPSHIRVLSSNTGKLEPDLVTMPFDADLVFTKDEQQTVLDLKYANQLDEVFRILFIKQCNALNVFLPALFEKINDYTELLLSLSVIDQDGVVYHLVHDIPEEDFDVKRGGQVEIIGWLYQYYNTELNDEVYDGSMSKGRISKELLPAATIIYTPDWVVHYMVENSLGRIWIEGHPNDSLKAGWKYYQEEVKQESEVQAKIDEIRSEYAKLIPEDIKVIDPCMGSGHILVYAFDVLMQIYESAGYGQRDAARSILENNLYGLDIDDRAFQMAYFAIMMKARQYNRRILNGEFKPNVYSIQESNGINREQLKYFGGGLNEFQKSNAIIQMQGLLDVFRDAKEYGSILKLEGYDWDLLYRYATDIDIVGQLNMYTFGLDETSEQLQQIIAQGRVLAQRYHVIITNPPYFNSSRFSVKLLTFVNEHYPLSKSDLAMIMYDQAISNLACKHGFIAFITSTSWMYLKSFEKIREYVIRNYSFVSLVDFGTELFDGKVGHNPIVSWITRKSKTIEKFSTVNLSEFCYSRRNEKEDQFFNTHNHSISLQTKFLDIEGCPIAYGLNDQIFEAYASGHTIGSVGRASEGIKTGNNELFLRYWPEVDFMKVSAGRPVRGYKWVPHHKGGEYHKWYGNNEWVINWENDGNDIKNYPTSGMQGKDLYLKPILSWSKITSKGTSFRYLPDNYLFDSGSPSFSSASNIKYYLGFLNSRVSEYLLRSKNPTLNCQVGDVKSLPVIDSSNKNKVESLVDLCIDVAREDWNSTEWSWDYEGHPLVRKGLSHVHCNNNNITVEDCFLAWKEECDHRFEKLKSIEEELNRIFIEIYGLQEELLPEVKDNEMTVRQANLQREIRSLLSYAVGCMFGRYSLGSTGLAYAGGEWNEEKYDQFKPAVDNIIPISDEEYLEDDIVSRLCIFLKVVFGEETLEENLNFIASALRGKGDSSRDIIRSYFMNEFFTDHCKIYSVASSGKRPIYWLFDSGKQNGFKALIYLHRYNTDTIGNLRIDYLHRMQHVYESEIDRMQDMINNSTNGREVGQAIKRRDKLTRQLKECREYDEKLAHLALSRIKLDLDDGVKVNYRKIQTANDGKFYEVLADSKNIMAKK